MRNQPSVRRLGGVVGLLLAAAVLIGTIGGGSAEARCRPARGRVPNVPPPEPREPRDPQPEPPRRTPQDPAPSKPQPEDPTTGEPEDPSTGAPETTPSTPSEPATPSTPAQPAPAAPTPEPDVPGPKTPTTGEGPQIGGKRRARPQAQSKAEWTWTTWWAFNRWNYLPSRNAVLRQHFMRFRTVTGEQTDVLRAWDRRRDELTRQRAAPALIALMRSKLSPGNEGIRAAGALALARMANDPLAVEAVMAEAEDRKASAEVRQAAAFAAGLFRRTDAKRQMPAKQADALRGRLFALVDDEKNSRTVRCLALMSIGMLGDQPNAGALPQGLLEIHGLWKRLIKRDQGTEVHVAYLTALGLEPGASSGNEIKDALKDIVMGKRRAKRRWNEQERSHALCTLVRLGGAKWRPVLTRLFAQKRLSTHVRRAAFITLGERAAAYDTDDRKALVQAWEGAMKQARDPLTKGLGLITLGRILAADLKVPGGGKVIRSTRAADLLMRELRSAPRTTRGFAVLAVAIAAREANGADRAIVRFRADAEKALLQGLARTAGNASNQGPYAVGVGILKSRAAIPTLEKLVIDSNQDQELRGLAAVALGQIGRAGPSTVKALKSAVADYKLGNLRLEAALGLAYLTGDRDSAFLRKDIERRRYTHSHQIGHVAIALGQMGDLRAVEPLCNLLLDAKSDHGARGAAAVALGLLCDPEEQPSLTRLWKDVNYPARSVAMHIALNYL